MNAIGEQRPELSGDAAVLASRVISATPDRRYRDTDVLRLVRRVISGYVDMPGIHGAAVLLRDDAGRLQLAGSSDQIVTRLEQAQLRTRSGPATEAVAQGVPISVWLADDHTRWRGFTAAARDAGFHGIDALPLRLDGHTIGVVDLYLSGPDRLTGPRRRVAVAFAQLATIALWQHGLWGKASALADQLQTALEVRVVTEQAKGMLARHAEVDVATAFGALRSFARRHNLVVDQVATSLVEGTRKLDEVLPAEVRRGTLGG
ncbi:MAG: GAF and ANTAR domain-containing protein [Nocardioidaceae bacterium]